VLERSGIAVPNLCRAGVCGQCKTRLLGGLADHRDLYLDAAEREPGGYIMPCVSRAQPGSDLELDL
jgi:ferredoxin